MTNYKEKKFEKMCTEDPSKKENVFKVFRAIYSAIADACLNEGRMKVRIGNELFPKDRYFRIDEFDDDVLYKIMKSKPGTKITLIRDGEEVEQAFGYNTNSMTF